MNAVKTIDDVSETTLIGGLRRQLRVALFPDRLAAFGVTAGGVTGRDERLRSDRTDASPGAGDREIAGVSAGRSRPNSLSLKETPSCLRVFVFATWVGGRDLRYLRDLRAVLGGWGLRVSASPRLCVLFFAHLNLCFVWSVRVVDFQPGNHTLEHPFIGRRSTPGKY